MKRWLWLLLFWPLGPAFSWGDVDHQLAYTVGALVASNDGGEDFALAAKILKENDALMQRAVLAPDNEPKAPLYPCLYHGHEAMLHVGFDGLAAHDSEYLAKAVGIRAVEKWQNKDYTGALFDLGCIMHAVQDAAFSGHCNFLHKEIWFKGKTIVHSAVEDWVKKQTTDSSGKLKPWEKLDAHGYNWVIDDGGVYLKQAWKDPSGRVHWDGGLESWIDVAAHLSYERMYYTATMDYTGCEFNGQIRQQLANSERCCAGLLVDFFRRVGVIPNPMVYYLRQGEIWRVRLGENNPERVERSDRLNLHSFWPQVSPNGKSMLCLGSYLRPGDGTHLNLNVGTNAWGWQLDRDEWPQLPKEICTAFYLNNYFVAMVDAAEKDNWQHLYLIQAVYGPSSGYDCYKNFSRQYGFDSPNGLWEHHLEVVKLP